MKKIVPLRPNQSVLPNMITSFRDSIVEGFNKIVDLGVFDAQASNCMIGFLSAACIACKCTGHLAYAQVFEDSAIRLKNDWTQFEDVCRSTVSTIDRLSQ